MRKFLPFLAAALMLLFSGCTQFDDSRIWDAIYEHSESIEDHEKRISALEELCEQINTDIKTLQTIVEVLEKRDYVTYVSEVRSKGEVIGYTISFANSDTITIYHGQDGQDGADGADGKDGYTPTIGVKQDTDNIYYWTLDGEWLLDENGNKIKASGTDGKDGQDGADGQDGTDGKDGENGQDGANGADGKDGQDGADGQDGITPQLKIENDYWYISYDYGTTWQQLGKATGATGATGSKGERGDSFFLDITQDDEYVYMTFVDGSQIAIPRLRPFTLSFSQTGTIEFQEGETIRLDYTLSYGYDETEIVVISDGGWDVDISRINNTSGVISISAPTVRSDAEIVLLATDGKGHSTMGTLLCSLTNSGTLLTVINEVYNVPAEATTIQVDIQTNIEQYDVIIPSSAQHWIALEEIATRTVLRDDVVKLSIAANEANTERQAYIAFVNSVLDINKTVLIKQQRGYADYTITYTSTDDSVVVPYDQSAFGGAKIVSNSYTNGEGKLIFDQAITEIGFNAWSGCTKLQSIVIPDSVVAIRQFAFEGCSALAEIVFGSGVELIEYASFRGCVALSRLNIPNNVTTLEEGVFEGCKFIDVVLSEGITVIPSNLFSGMTSLNTITMGSMVTEIGDKAFYNCTSLKAINLPSSLTKICSKAFCGCTAIRKLQIPSSVTYIGDSAFSGCSNLSYIICSAKTPATGSVDMFSSISTNAVISVPFEAVNTYRTAPYWNLYVMHIFSEDGIAVPYTTNAIYYTSTTGKIVTPNNKNFGQANIASNTYNNNQGIILFDRELTTIGNYAFYYCESLTSITIPDGVTEIGEGAFAYCSSLTSVTIPDSVTSIGDYAFDYCTSLTSVYITDIAAWCGIAFSDNSANPLSYANNLYLNGELVTDLVIPDSVTSIGSYTFYGCSSLASVTIPDSVTSIGSIAFFNCSSLTSVYCKPTTPPSGGSYMFSYSYGYNYRPIGCKIYVPTESVSAYKAASYWSNYSSYIEGYDFE